MKKLEEIYPNGYGYEALVPWAELQRVYAVSEAMEELLGKITIDNMQLSHRLYNCFRKANIRTYLEALETPIGDLLAIRNFGEYGVKELFSQVTEDRINELYAYSLLSPEEKREIRNGKWAEQQQKSAPERNDRNKEKPNRAEQKQNRNKDRDARREEEREPEAEREVSEEAAATEEEFTEVSGLDKDFIPEDGEVPEGYYKERFYSSRIVVPNGDERAFTRYFVKQIDKLDEKCLNTSLPYLCSGELCEVLMRLKLYTMADVKEYLLRDGNKQKLLKHREELCAVLHFLDKVIRIMPV